jgi:type I restriction enzyme S subunit
MNATELLALYEQVADAPDAVTKLQSFVLDLAVRGKLVAQDTNDEPASELLCRMVGQSIAVPAEAPSEEPKPFELPHVWSWTRVGDVCSKTGSGSTPRGGQAAYKSSGVPFLRSQNVYDDGLRLADVVYIDDATHARMSGTAVLPMDLLLNITGGSMGRCCLVPMDAGPANISQHVAIIRPAVDGMSSFMHCLVRSPYFQSFIFDEQTGAGRGGLPKNRMDRISIPLPPLAEQHRIVAKVDELMALCDQLEAARTEREVARDRLASASLARINAPDPETFQSDARFALSVLPALSARPDQVTQLRQTILNLAVRGKLVPQEPHDEPASRLLERIAEAKRIAGLTAATSVQGTADGAPAGWVVTTLGAYSIDVFTGPFGSMLHQSDYVNDGVPLVNPSHMKGDRIVPDQRVSVSSSTAKRLFAYHLDQGDILMARRGEVGRAALVEAHQRGWICGTGSFFLRFTPEVNRSYLLLCFRTSSLREYLAGRAVGTTMVNLNHGILKKAPLLIPPLAEQDRIVAKVEELMALCDQLEASVSAGEAARGSLLEALLHEALDSENATVEITTAATSSSASRLQRKTTALRS